MARESLRLRYDQRGAPRTGGPDDGSKFAYFDGFQTYNLGALNGQNPNAPVGGGVGAAAANSIIVDAAGEVSCSPNDPASANLQSPRHPYAPDPYPQGTNSREQILKDNRTDVLDMGSIQQIQWTLAADGLYTPTSGDGAITAIDVYFNNYEMLGGWVIGSSTEQLVVTRVLDAGRLEGSAFTSSTGGVLDRPMVLGQGAGPGPVGEFYAPPLIPRNSSGTPVSLQRFRTQTGGWSTYAILLTTQGVSVYVRNNRTDGSLGIIIEEGALADDPVFSSGWYRCYPGRPAEESWPGVWAGYGIALDESGNEANQSPHFVAARTFDFSSDTWFGAVGTPSDTEFWFPCGKYYDNWAIIGMACEDLCSAPCVSPQPCPPGSTVVTQNYELTGAATGAPWSWRIEDSSGQTVAFACFAQGVQPYHDFDGDSMSGTAGDLAWRFAQSINNYATAFGCASTLSATSGFSGGIGLLDISVSQAPGAFKLYVGDACDCASNEVLENTPTPFNPEITMLPAPPPCPWDLTGSGMVSSADLGFLLGCWGANVSESCLIADFTGSNTIGSGDLAVLLGNWGPCP